MQKAQRIIKTYRRNRMIVCTICALVTLASTLSVRFISQRNLNQQRVVQFANHAVEELDKVLLPLQAGSEVLLPLIGLPCSVAHLPLRKQAAKTPNCAIHWPGARRHTLLLQHFWLSQCARRGHSG
ncbi:putative signal transduction protein [Escherichia coli]|nr:putative signal transduction protein [Escherichia coli]